MPHRLEIQTVTSLTCQLGEGPVWDAMENCICWIDILRKQIHQFYLPERRLHSLTLPHYIGSIVFANNNRLLAATQHGYYFIDRLTGDVEFVNDPEAHLINNRFNDGKCDPAGRFWAGTMSHSDEPHAGTLYALEKNLSVKEKIKGTTISNGLAWTRDAKTFYHIDTPTRSVAAYDYVLADGSISNKKIAIAVPIEDGYPDGMTIDEEDMLWIAHWDGGQVTRWDPRSGKKLLSIKMPVTRITCCTFGGENMDELYVTSARKDLNEAQLLRQPLAGSLFVIKDIGFKGLPPARFTANKKII